MGSWRPHEPSLGRGGQSWSFEPRRPPPGTQPGRWGPSRGADAARAPPAEPPRARLRAGGTPRPQKKARGASGGLQVCQARVLRSACSCLRRERLEIPVKVAGGEAIGPTAAFGAGGGVPVRHPRGAAGDGRKPSGEARAAAGRSAHGSAFAARTPLHISCPETHSPASFANLEATV